MNNIVWCSGGKNSIAMLLIMQEKSISIDKVQFHDTGVDLPGMKEYVINVCESLDLDIEITHPKKSFDEQFFKIHKKGVHEGEIWGFPYSKDPCWILRDLKALKPCTDAVNFIGISADEGERRERKMYEKGNFRFPLVESGITDRQCLDMLSDAGFKNPLYEHFGRTGCWLCPKQPKKSLEALFRFYPEYWYKLREYDRLCPHEFKDNISLDQIERKLGKTPMITSYA